MADPKAVKPEPITLTPGTLLELVEKFQDFFAGSRYSWVKSSFPEDLLDRPAGKELGSWCEVVHYTSKDDGSCEIRLQLVGFVTSLDGWYTDPWPKLGRTRGTVCFDGDTVTITRRLIGGKLLITEITAYKHLS